MAQTKPIPYAFFPFLRLKEQESICLGPILFWKDASAAEGVFATLRPTINALEQPLIFSDGLYVLYFISSFQDFYYDRTPPSFDCFSQFLLVKDQDMSQIRHFHQEDPFILPSGSSELCHGLSIALDTLANGSKEPLNQESELRRMILSIRFFINSSIKKMRTPFYQLRSNIDEPEAIVSLMTAFEALFHINPSNPCPDMKQKLRPMLHLKFSKPVEIFWKWVDGLYSLRKHTLDSLKAPEPFFRENPNLEVSYTYLGRKLFIYSLYYKLFSNHLITSKDNDRITPPHFQDIQPEEILVYLWPEENLLRKISILLMQIVNHHNRQQYMENVEEIRLLAQIYLVYASFGSSKSTLEWVTFSPSQFPLIKDYLQAILSLSEEFRRNQLPPVQLFPDSFVMLITKRWGASIA